MQQAFENFLIEDDGPSEAETVDYRLERNLARAAEFFVAFDLSKRGHDVFTVGEGLRYDLIADVSGVRRIQVKSSRRAVYRGATSNSTSYLFGGKSNLLSYSNDIDLFAFVAMDRMVVLYAIPGQMRRAKLHLDASKMTPEASDLSWQQVLRFWGLEP